MTTTQTLDTLMAEFVRRRRRLRATGVCCLAVTAAIVWLVVASVIDRLLALSPNVRLLALCGLGLLMLLAAMRIAQLIFSTKFDRLIAAAQIEAMTPALRDRLLTVVTQQNLPASQRGSEELTGLLRRDAAELLARRRPEKLITNRYIAPAIALLVFVCVVTLALAFVPWLGLPKLLARQVMPLADIPPVTTTHIEVITGSVSLPQGQSVAIVADITHADGGATLLVGPDERSLQPVAMAQTFADRFAVTLPAVERDLLYRVRAGDAISAPFTIRTLTRPALAKLRLTLGFPDYLSRPPLTIDSTDGRIEAVRGTRVGVRLQATEPLKDATLKFGDDVVPTLPTIDPYVREATFTVKRSGAWSIDMLSQRDVQGGGFAEMQVACVDDRPPIVQFVRSDLRLHPSDVAAVPFQAIDDFGVEKLRLDVAVGDKKLVSRQVDLGAERRMIRDVATVDLAPHALVFGDVVSITLTAVDGAGQSRAGAPCRVLLSPRSVDPRVLRRIDAIGDALKLAETISRQPADSALCLRTLLRVVAASDTTVMSDFLEKQVDRAQVITSGQVWGAPSLGDYDKDTVARLVASLRVLHRGEQARLLQAELENLRAAEQQKKDLTKAERDALVQSVQRARGELESRLRGLQIDPKAGDVAARLQRLVAACDEQLKVQARPSAVSISEEWAKQIEPDRQRDRVAILAQAQVLRSDGDLPWAKDLQTIARAMSTLRMKSQKPPEGFVKAVRAVEDLHLAARKQSPGWEKLVAPAEAARKQLREWSGENAPKPDFARSPLETSLDESARLEEEHRQAMARATEEPGDAPDGPEKWQPPSDEEGKGDASDDPAATEAKQLSAIAQQQQRVNRRTESASEAAARSLSSQQQQIADALDDVERDREEDFFQKDEAPQREQALEALRSAQRALADLPQQVAALRRQAEMLATMKQSQDRAQAAAKNASEADRAAAERALAEAQKQVDQARQQLGQSASGVASGTSSSLQSSAQRLGSLGLPMTTGDKELGSAIESLQKSLADADLAAAEQQQLKVLDTVASLQASLRVAQRKTVDRDPVIAARFFAGKAAEALRQEPPDMVAAREYQSQTSEALDRAWDAAMARNVKDKLEGLPAFQSLFFDEFAFDGMGGDDGPILSLDRTVVAEWGRLRDKRDASATAGNAAFVPPGYEEQLKLYFQALDEAKSGRKQP